MAHKRIPSAIIRKRKRLYTQAELAKELGCSMFTVSRMESGATEFVTPLFLDYLKLVGWKMAFYPMRKSTATPDAGPHE